MKPTISLVVLVTTVLACPHARAGPPAGADPVVQRSDGEITLVDTKKNKRFTYHMIAASGHMSFEATGPALLEIKVRQILPEDEDEAEAATMISMRDGEFEARANLDIRPAYRYQVEGLEVTLSRATKVQLEIPLGKHSYHIRVSEQADDGAVIRVRHAKQRSEERIASETRQAPAAGPAEIPLAAIEPAATATEPPVADNVVPAPEESAADTSGRAVRVAVYQLKAAGLDEEKLNLISTSLLAEIRKLQRVSAMGMDEIQAMLLVEEQKQLLGCEDDSCLAEIAGALGADYLIVGNVGKVGESSVFTIKRLDMQKTGAVKSANRRMKGGSGEELLEALGPAVEELFPDYMLRPGLTRGVHPELVERWNPPPLKPWLFWSTAGAGAAALATSGIFYGLQRAAEDDFDKLADRSAGQMVPGEDLVEAQNRAESNHTRALAMLGVGAGLAVAAGVLALFTDWDSGLEISPTLGPSSGGVAISGKLPQF